MKTNDSINSCPKCGALIPAEAPEGLCPRCVLAAAASAEPAPTATSQIPSLERLAVAFPQLQIIELIGRGGMGFVFKARQPHLDRFVALKVLPDSLAHDPQFAERFNREGRVLARLNHPNIVSIFDFGQAGGFYYLLMEYVDGVNLRQAMQAGRFSPSEALAIVPRICEALQFAHEEGILHRDIKPENILLDAKGRVKIADFGIAKLVGEEKSDASLTATGATLGTMNYMAPEQIEKPSTVDHRADIYSLGVVFYELLTGELPLGRFGPPSAKTPVDSRVDDVVMRTLEKEREKRFQSAGEMKTSVEHLTATGAGGAKPVGPGSTAPDFILCHPRLPRMAQAITVFALVVMPAFWFIDVVLADDATHPNAYAAFIEAVMRLGVFWGELLTTVLLFIGGWKLRVLKKSGPQIIRVALCLNMVILCLVICGTVWIEMLAPDTRLARPTPGEAVLAVTQVAAMIFQICALVWLRRNRATLNNIFQTAASGMGPGGTMVIPPAAGLSPVHAFRPGSVLKWVLPALLLFGGGVILVVKLTPKTSVNLIAVADAPAATNTAPWIRFTFTAVELRETQGVRWLAIDYLDDVHGECEKAFPWETTIPGFKAEIRTSEFLKEVKGSPAVRHQRIEYRMPDSSPRDQLERLRDNLEKVLKQKSFRLEPGEDEVPLLLFELPGAEGGLLKARIKVMLPLQAKNVGSLRKLELRIPTYTDNTYSSVGVTTESDLPMGDYIVGLLKHPDGREEEFPVATTIHAGLGPIRNRVLRHLIWPLGQFESNRVRGIEAEMRATLDGRVVELVLDGDLRAFQIKNVHGEITEGFIALRSQHLSVTGLPPVSVSIAGVRQNWGRFLSVGLLVSAPEGYTPYAVGLLSDGSELETTTSIQGRGRAGQWAGDYCYWHFPQEFQAGDVQEIVRQLEAIKVTSPNGIRILPGQLVPMFSVTNKTGIIFRGYFALPALTGTK